jgi:hypothetical protein
MIKFTRKALLILIALFTVHTVKIAAQGTIGTPQCKTSSTGCSTEKHLDLYKVPAITIDGIEDDYWKFLPSYQARNLILQASLAEGDCDPSFKVAWNDDYLYLYFQVKDDKKIAYDANISPNRWLFDNCEVFINPRYDNDDPNGLYGSDGIHIPFNYGEKNNVFTGEGWKGDASYTGLKYTSIDTPDGYIIEAQVPWTGILPSGMKPYELLTIGIEVYVHDADNTTTLRDAIRTWADDTKGDNAWHDTRVFGYADFKGMSAIPNCKNPSVAKTGCASEKYLDINKVTKPIVIDGVEEDTWGKVSENTALNDANIYPGYGFTGAGDCDVKFKAAWDANNFYILVKVDDNSLIAYDNVNNEWEYDAIEVFMNPDFKNDNPDGSYGTDAIHFRMNYGMADNHFTGDGWKGDATHTGFEYKSTKTSTGYILEGKFPWPSCFPSNVLPSEGLTIGFDLLVDDADSKEKYRKGIRTWADDTKTDVAWKDTRSFGYAGLKGTVDPPLAISYPTRDLCLDSTYTITWTGGNPKEGISIGLIDIASDAVDLSIANVIPNTGSYQWICKAGGHGAGQKKLYIQNTSGTSWAYGQPFMIYSKPRVLNVSTNTLTISAPANSTKTFTITSNISWSATSSQSWLAVSSGTGSGNATITLTATASPTTATRAATVTVSAAGAPIKTITVTQDGIPPVLNVSTNTMNIAASANSTKTFDITSNTNWTVSSNQSWLTVSKGTGSGNTSITLTASANPATSTRTATVTVSGTGLTTQTITVTQEGGAPVLNVSANTLSIAAQANSNKTFDITSNTNWTAASNQSWLTVNNASGSGNATITLTASANPTTATRTATITVSGTGISSKTISVTQDGATPVLTVSTNNLTIAAQANSTKTFDVTSNTNWIVSSNQSWLTVNTASGSGNATITLTASANPTIATRTATVAISGTGATSQSITITQDGATPVLAVSTNTLTIAAQANSTKTFDITSNTNWTVASDQSWLTVNSGTGTGNSTITLTASANTATATRTATVTVSGTGTTAQTITVTQDGAVDYPPLKITSPSQDFYIDKVYTITWSGGNPNETVSIGLIDIAADASDLSIADGIPNTGSYQWVCKVGGFGIGLKKFYIENSSKTLWAYGPQFKISEQPVLSVSTNTLSIAALANSTKTFNITSNTSWTVASNQNWLSVSTGGASSGSATVTLTATANPTTEARIATITVSGTGVSTKTITVTQEAGTTGINKVSEKEIFVYPNPVNEILNLEMSFEQQEEVIIELYNSSGQKIMEKTMKGFVLNERISLGQYSNGIYLLKLQVGTETKIFKLVKQ